MFTLMFAGLLWFDVEFARTPEGTDFAADGSTRVFDAVELHTGLHDDSIYLTYRW